jgi:hypothetical protein
MKRRRSIEGIDKALRSYEWLVADMTRRMSPVVSDQPPTADEIERLDLLSHRLGGIWANTEQQLASSVLKIAAFALVIALLLEVLAYQYWPAFPANGVLLLLGGCFVAGMYLVKARYSEAMTIRPLLSVHRFLGIYPLIPKQELHRQVQQRVEAARQRVPAVKRYLAEVNEEGRSLTQFEIKQILSIALMPSDSKKMHWTEITLTGEEDPEILDQILDDRD